MKSKALLVAFFSVIFFVSATGVRHRRKKGEVSVDQKRNSREYDMLKELLGTPKGNPAAARAIKGTKRTTRLHRICSWKKHMKGKPDEWSEDTTSYDKLICGLYTMKDEYRKHERRVAQILTGKHNGKTLDEQKKDLIEAVNNMAKAAGPLPRLKFVKR